MTATRAPAAAPPRQSVRGPGLAWARLLRIELRRGAMPWILPVAVALFFFTTYRKAMAMPPLWNMRADALQSGALLSFACPVAGAAAWLGSRDRRRRTADLVTTTAQPRWARLLAIWAATACWAIVGYLGCVAVLYGVTARQGAWGGPLWWPVAVTAAAVSALAAIGLAAGTLAPSRFTAPLTAIASFFVIALSTQLIVGGQSYWQISPVVSGPWDLSADPGVGTFYPVLPDLSIAQVMFLAGLTVAVLGALALPTGPHRWLRRPAAAATVAGLLAAGTAVALAGTGRMNAHGMIAIPALHDAASDRPLRYTPVCSPVSPGGRPPGAPRQRSGLVTSSRGLDRTAIPVCLNPAYASYLPVSAAALRPVLNEIAGLPGAPARISQAATTYRQNSGNSVSIGMAGPSFSGTPPVFRMVFPFQLGGPPVTTGEVAAAVRSAAGPALVASVTGDGPGAAPAQQAVAAALRTSAGLPEAVLRTAPSRQQPNGAMVPLPAAVQAAARRFAALPAPARHAWLVRHLTALRAGRITLAELP